MAKYSNQRVTNRFGTSPITTVGEVQGWDKVGFERDSKSELFLLAVQNMVSEGAFYEDAKTRDKRYVQLIHAVTQEDAEWMQRFIPWLRQEAYMRTASIVAAAEYVKAGGPNGRKVVDSALQRADEPAEILAYWATEYGYVQNNKTVKKFPAALKRGVADAVRRLYTQRSYIKYGGSQYLDWHMADVIELVRPKPVDETQDALFKYMLDERHHPDKDRRPPDALWQLVLDSSLKRMPESERRGMLTFPEKFKAAAWTWEKVSGWVAPMDKQAWEAIIPTMGYMGLLRNLRNFEEKGVSESTMNEVRTRLTNPAEVARSKQLPGRFLSAFIHTGNLMNKAAIEFALNISLANIPTFPGRTLILVDVSSSMLYNQSGKSKLTYMDTAALFGTALALRSEQADLFAYADYIERVPFTRGASVLPIVDTIRNKRHGGTNTFGALLQVYEPGKHDRIVILTDEQHNYGVGSQVGAMDRINKSVFVHTFNLVGYKMGHAGSGSGNWHTYGGLTDAGFGAMLAVEQFGSGNWPF